MRLIENNHIRLRDKLPETGVFHHAIRHKQVMVDHHHIRFQRLAPGLQHKAFFILRAVAAEAVIVGTGDQRPDRAVFRNIVTGGDIPQLRRCCPAPRRHYLREGFRLHINIAESLLLQPLQTEIVRAPFEQCHPAVIIQRLNNGGEIAVIELILQRFGAGGNNSFLSGTQRGYQIGKRFAGPGSGFRHQLPLRFNYPADRRRHGDLGFPRLKTRNDTG
ncbi:Uncharacterised protein [Morganella morganii]|nr:Uncharacterised protein [Morganella morganii]